MYIVYIFVYVYICIYINIYINRRANGIYIQKSCSIWTVCPCLFLGHQNTYSPSLPYFCNSSRFFILPTPSSFFEIKSGDQQNCNPYKLRIHCLLELRIRIRSTRRKKTDSDSDLQQKSPDPEPTSQNSPLYFFVQYKT